jgi:hypothetical protein
MGIALHVTFRFGAREFHTGSDLDRGPVVVDDFDVVTVGVKHIRGVVAGVVAGALPRLAVAAVSGCGRVRMEAAYFIVAAREGDVGVLRRLSGDHEETAV